MYSQDCNLAKKVSQMRLAHSNILTVFLFTSFLQKQHKQHGTALNIKPLQQLTNSPCIRDDERLPTFTGPKEFFVLCLRL